MTWLTALQQSGYTLTMQGRCLTLTSLSDFIGNLEASRYFIRPVEIIESTVDTDDNGPELILFTIRGTFQMAGVESVAPPPPGAKGGEEASVANLSLAKLPWHAQIGAIVAIALGVGGAFYYFYEMPQQAADRRRRRRS